MQTHELKRKTKNKKSIKVGRGGTRGKTAGRGTKGQRARSGRKLRPELRDIIKKLPKLRGRGKNSFLSIQTKPETVSLSDIQNNFKAGDKVSPATLAAKNVIPHYKGKKVEVKVLSSGSLSIAVTLVNCLVSEKAKEAIEKAGGSVK